MRQATLVAFYDQKRGELGHLLRTWQDRLARAIRQIGAETIFRPYPPAQVHATVLGLERLPQPALYNRNMLDFRGELRTMRLPELFGFILGSGRLPFDAQFGGFEDRDYPFRSLGAPPFQRSFSIQGKTAVVIGWPARAARRGRLSTPDWPPVLDELRRSAQRSTSSTAGIGSPPMSTTTSICAWASSMAASLRILNASWSSRRCGGRSGGSPPSTIRIRPSDLAVVAYPDGEETLPVDQSEVVRLSDPRLRREGFVAELYAWKSGAEFAQRFYRSAVNCLRLSRRKADPAAGTGAGRSGRGGSIRYRDRAPDSAATCGWLRRSGR